jgi:transposase-like protein
MQEKGGIIALHEKGVSINDIAYRFNCHPNIVKRWIKRHEETFDVN